MPIHFFYHVLDVHLPGIQLHFFSVLCQIKWFVLSKDYSRTKVRNLLNFTNKELGSPLSLGRTEALTLIVCRALAGRWARNERHVLPGLLKGLNFVDTSEMNLVIISRGEWTYTRQWIVASLYAKSYLSPNDSQNVVTTLSGYCSMFDDLSHPVAFK